MRVEQVSGSRCPAGRLWDWGGVTQGTPAGGGALGVGGGRNWVFREDEALLLAGGGGTGRKVMEDSRFLGGWGEKQEAKLIRGGGAEEGK